MHLSWIILPWKKIGCNIQGLSEHKGMQDQEWQVHESYRCPWYLNQIGASNLKDVAKS